MTDSTLRELERRFFATQSPEDELAWRREKLRAGELSSEQEERLSHFEDMWTLPNEWQLSCTHVSQNEIRLRFAGPSPTPAEIRQLRSLSATWRDQTAKDAWQSLQGKPSALLGSFGALETYWLREKAEKLCVELEFVDTSVSRYTPFVPGRGGCVDFGDEVTEREVMIRMLAAGVPVTEETYVD